MSTADLLPETLPPVASADAFRPMHDRKLAILARLAEAGLEIAVALEAQAKGGEAVVEGDVAMAFNRVARAVRQTLMLQDRVIEAMRGRAAEDAELRAAAKAGAARILRGVIDDDPLHDRERGERLGREAAERLEREDFSDLLTRPFGEAVAAICKDLGLSPDGLKLAEDCHAAEKGFTGKPGAEPEDDIWRGPLEVQWLRPTRPADSS